MGLKFKIKINDIVGVCCFLPFLKTGAFEYLSPTLDILIDIWLVLVGVYLAIQYISMKRIKSQKLLFAGLIIFALANMISTYINQGVFKAWAFAFIRLIIMYLFIEVMVISKRISYSCLIIPLETLFLANILCWILYPTGMYTMIGANGMFYSDTVWLMGGKNAYFYYVLFVVVIRLLENNDKQQSKISGKRILQNSILYVLVLINVLVISKSATSIIGTIMIVVYLLFEKKGIFKTKKTVFIYAIGNIYLFISLVVLNSSSELLHLVSNVTGKSVTFTHRTLIWARTVNAIKQNYLWGYGFENYEKTVSTIGQATAHNKYLWILYRGGIISGILFALFIYLIMNQLYKAYGINLSKRLAWIVFVVMITWLVEVYDNNCLIFAFFLLCYHVADLNTLDLKAGAVP